MTVWKRLQDWLASVTGARAAGSPRAWLDPRPADGVVEIMSIEGLDGRPNPRDPRFSRFEPDPSSRLNQAPAPVASAPRRQTPCLGGRVVLMSLFVGRDGRRWSDEEVARAHRALEGASVWLEEQAVRWGAPLNVALSPVYFETLDEVEESVAIDFVPEGDHFGPLEAQAAFKCQASASRASAQLGFTDFADLAGRVSPLLPADYWVWLLHPLRAGRSLAIPEPEATLPGVNLAVCYAREASFSEPLPLSTPPFTDPVTIVHEILHLFGASDKYGLSLSHFPAHEVTARDVMILRYESLSRIRVDPLTAREVGWLDLRLPPVLPSGRRDMRSEP